MIPLDTPHTHHHLPHHPHPHAVFALSKGLLAYACPPKGTEFAFYCCPGIHFCPYEHFFPGMGGAGRLSISLSSAGASASTRPSVLTKMMDTPGLELSPKGRVVATRDLRRRRDWGGIKRRFCSHAWSRVADEFQCCWLSQAEISTFSKSQRVLPWSLYLSHQFSFHTLGQDPHSMIPV